MVMFSLLLKVKPEKKFSHFQYTKKMKCYSNQKQSLKFEKLKKMRKQISIWSIWKRIRPIVFEQNETLLHRLASFQKKIKHHISFELVFLPTLQTESILLV